MRGKKFVLKALVMKRKHMNLIDIVAISNYLRLIPGEYALGLPTRIYFASRVKGEVALIFYNIGL